jgi:hypothetical protein
MNKHCVILLLSFKKKLALVFSSGSSNQPVVITLEDLPLHMYTAAITEQILSP